jgi:hypothetical protein
MTPVSKKSFGDGFILKVGKCKTSSNKKNRSKKQKDDKLSKRSQKQISK